MEEQTTPSPPPPPPPKKLLTTSLIQASPKKRHKNKPKLSRLFRSVVRSFPIITSPTSCSHYHLPSPRFIDPHKGVSGTQVTGTLFGHRRGKVSLSIQETSRCLSTAVIELPMLTTALQKELVSGMVRMAFECEKRPGRRTAVMEEEEGWTAYCNGKMMGGAVKRESTVEDLNVMEVLKAVTMGAGVLPVAGEEEEEAEELACIRAHFEHVVGSKDCQTLYMMSPEGHVDGPELSIFFLRV